MLFGYLTLFLLVELCSGLLYPRESASRDVRLMDGVWNFRADFSVDREAGFVEEWYSKPLALVSREERLKVTSHISTALVLCCLSCPPCPF